MSRRPLPSVRAAAALSVAACLALAGPAGAQPAPDRPAAKPARAAPAPARATPPSAAPAPAPDFAARDDVRAFVREMVERHGFDEPALLAVFGRTRGAETVARLMSPAPPGFRRSWIAYRGRFVEPIRIREGLRFWRDNAETVRRASERWGVPPEILVSIIGVETIYGRQVGDFRVMDALTTLAFDYPRRAAYFREELEQYLLLARESGFDPLEWRGSFAGAVGLPQFMPGSVRRHAVDFDGDGRVDLRHSVPDAIGSVARFLADHGWRSGAPTHFTATVEDEARAKPAVEAGIPPKLTSLELAELGVTSPQEIPVSERLALIDLPNGDDTTHYVIGANNFWVITRYNRSYFYAMAVIDLARALREGMGAAQASLSAR
ncbi:MAG TPA: lytic murein transglycosylase B [Burkholderiaceae bacterium]|nr:lytic murein transglycosylase B [Burkholderiaceae bacterium]